ncbi:unnamed protein product [Staurois parvus]|uniref:Uncharacterized protein n=1 Tax=Staurois parvus TaxID=386267 RepID=A0ABN9C290_9NEOB|nr:unnamed protein product [Staurois parvus]
MSLVKITQIRMYFLVCRKVIEFTNYGIYLNIDQSLSTDSQSNFLRSKNVRKVQISPNDPFLQSRQSDVLHKRNGKFFEVVFFLS